MTADWVFPPSNGGNFDGFNDSGIATYTGARFNSLAREIIQNSLDAQSRDNDKVTVEFDVVNLKRKDFPGIDKLMDTMKRCKFEVSNEKEKMFFQNAETQLSKNQILCLKISDYGTTGMCGDYRKRKGQWHAITKARGSSEKRDPTAGGSYGIGKHASFAVSSLRTVFYATRYEESGKTVHRAQGKSILVSHCCNNSDDYTQGTGFYGKTEGCHPLETNIPQILKPKEQGSTVFITGFTADKNWQHKIVATVLSNFFYAIDQGKLEVLIQDDKEDVTIINSNSIDENFKKILDMDIDNESVSNSYWYYRTIKKAKSREAELPYLGNCKIWVMKKEGSPKKVALLRKTGMLITDNQKKLQRWPGRLDFAGVFLCDSDKGNILLREMENPKHDAFEPERATLEKDVLEFEKTLKELVKWVRERIDELAKPDDDDGPTKLDELNDLLPDTDPEESIPGDKGDERNIEGKPVYSPKPLKESTHKSSVDDKEGDYGGAGAGDGRGGNGSGIGTEEGEGSGGTGNKSPKKQFEIENVRVVSNRDNPMKKTVYFTATEKGEIHVSLAFAGDDGQSYPIQLLHYNEESILVNVKKQNERKSIEVILKGQDKEANDSIVVKAYKNEN